MALNITGNNLFWQSRIDNTRLRADAMKTQSIFNGLGKSIGKAAIFAGVGIAAGLAIREIIKVNVKFEKSMSLLSSLTGAVGEDLDFYRKKAIEFGESTTQSATQIADAFKLIGSKKPELLTTKEALAQVTKEAITLAEAANVDVTTAASALTTSLNLMSAGAERSAEFINILAAASQKGAGDIPYLDAALEKSAKVAHDYNLTFAETTSMIEHLAPAFKEPSSAGLHFKSVLLRLAKQGYGFSSGMFDLQDALQEVRSELDGIKDLAKRSGREIDIMGVRSSTAGKVMLESRNSFKDFADTISGTNTAFEQAQTNTDNVAGSIIKLKSALEGAVLKNSDFTDSLKGIIDTLTDTVRWLGENWVWIEKLIKTYLIYIAAIKGTALAISLYNKISKIALLFQKQKIIQTGTLTAAQLGYTGVVKSSTIAQTKLNKAMKANVIALVIAGVYAAVQIFKQLNKQLTEAEQNQKTLNELNFETEKRIVNEKSQLALLLNVARDETKTKEQRLKAIKRLNEISPEYLGNLTLEKINTDEARIAIEKYIDVLSKKAKFQAAQERLVELDKEISKIEYKWTKGWKALDTYQKVMVHGNEILYKAHLIGQKQQLLEQRKFITDYLKGTDLLLETAERFEEEEEEKEGPKFDKLKKSWDTQLKMKQAFELAKFKLIADNETQIAAFRKDQEIEYLTEEIRLNTDLEQIQIDTNLKKIELLTKERDEIIKSQFETFEDKKQHVKDMFKIEQELALAKFLVITDNENEITKFKIDQEIARLNNQILYNDLLTADEKETLAEKIKLLEKQKEAVGKAISYEEMLFDVAEKAGGMIASAMKNSEDSAESFGETMKKVTREVILMLVAESVAHVMKDVFKEAGWAGLVLAPIAGAAASAILSSVIPKFEKGKPADYTGGGIVGGQGNKDTELGYFTPNEIVYNQKQKDNLLWNLGQYRSNNSKMEKLISETNTLLKNAKSAIVKGNAVYVVKNGTVIGGKTFLS